METFTIEVQPREKTGSADSRRGRSAGLIPSVIYARGAQTILGSLARREFLKLARSAKGSQVFLLRSPLAEINGKSAVIKEIQKNHLNDEVLHVDLQTIREDEEITVKVNLTFLGEAPGVKLEGGILTVVCHELGITCLPRLIPEDIKVDVSQLNLGSSIHAKELPLPEGVKLSGNAEETIVSVVAVHVQAAAEEVAAPVEGEAVEGAEGAAAPEGGAPAAEGKEKKEAAPQEEVKEAKKK